VPTRHIHQVIESVHQQDILSSVELLKNCLLELDNQNWKHPS